MNRTIALFAFISGITTGALFGILFAPDKGSNTRDRLSFRLDMYRKRLEEAMGEIAGEKDAPSNEARTEGQKVVSDAREKAEKLLDDVDELIAQIKKGA